MTDERTPYFPEQTEHQDILTTMGLLDFVWDAAKNEHNIAIHHVSFETAMLVFNDVLGKILNLGEFFLKAFLILIEQTNVFLIF